MRRASRTDSNHAAIVEAYEAHGCTVLSLARMGDGCPDLLVGYRGRLALVEVKAARGRLRPAQEDFQRRWPVRVVRTVDDVQAHLGALRASDAPCPPERP